MTPQHLEDELRQIVEVLQVEHARAKALCDLSAVGLAHAWKIKIPDSIIGDLAGVETRIWRLLNNYIDEPFRHESEIEQ